MVRGRKRKPGKRLPCGKRPREDVRKEAMATVMAARQRHYGVTAAQAKDERLGTALGRLAFADQITPDQYAAGEIYGEIMARNRARPRRVSAIKQVEVIVSSKVSKLIVRKAAQPLDTPTDLPATAVKEISAVLNVLLADSFALYLKTKNFHWHVSGPHFRSYHLMLDEQADQIFGTTDELAERVFGMRSQIGEPLPQYIEGLRDDRVRPASLATVSGLVIRSAQMRDEDNPLGSVGMWVNKLTKGFGR